MKIEELQNVEKLQNMVIELWQLLDNIDTIEDMVKADDKAFRTMTREQHRKRFTILTSDGYGLFLPEVDGNGL